MKLTTISRITGLYIITTTDESGKILREVPAYNKAMALDVARILSELHHTTVRWDTD